MSLTPTQPLHPPGYVCPPITINVNAGKSDDDKKKDDKKEKSSLPGPGEITYTALEIGVIHYAVILTGFLNKDPKYQRAWLAGLVAGSAFGLYKAWRTGEQPGLKQRAEAFEKSDLCKKAHWAATVLFKAGLVIAMQNIPETNNLGHAAAAYWGLKLGTDIPLHLYNSIFEKKAKKGD